jgi:hypothetical protein
VVESDYGFHLIMATGAPTQEQQLTLEECRDTIVSVLQGQHAQAALDGMKQNGSVSYSVDVDPQTGEPRIQGNVSGDDSNEQADSADE